MTEPLNVSPSEAAQKPCGFFDRLRADTRGVTAVEFAMVAGPFLMMLFGIIAVGLFFFTTFTMENAVEQAARFLRTGQAQLATPPYTEVQFKNKVCSYLPSNIDCAGKVKVNVKAYPNAADITAASLPKCINNSGDLNTTTEFNMGDASQVLLVWACYEWELANKIPFLKVGDMSNGSRLIQATTVFRAEPYK